MAVGKTVAVEDAQSQETISRLIESWTRRTPDAPAILSPGKPDLTYEVLWEMVESVAGHLHEAGIGRKDRIAIVLPNGPEMAVSFLAVGSCAVSAPLNPAFKASEFEFYLSDLGASALIVEEACDSPAIVIAEAQGIPILELTSKPSTPAGTFTLSKRSSGNVLTEGFSEKDDLALALHTSGTTSRPKMVPLTHRNLCLSAHNIARWFKLTDSDRCLNLMPLFHIHGLIASVLSSIASGGSVVCTPGFDSTRCFEWIAQCKPTWYTAVPTMHQAILARVYQNPRIAANHGLRFIRSCSAALPPTLLAGLRDALRIPVLESYGMTEASHQIASNPLPPLESKVGSVGLATGPEVAIMDRQGNILVNGRKGEIVLRGHTITRGYEGNTEANQQAFTRGWFRTGDEGYIDDEGYVFISDRLKEIINRGGEKISPREIDEVLLRHPEVAQAVSFSIPHVQLGEDVGAAVVLKADSKVRESDLRRFAAKDLAFFKVPRVICRLDEIPKGPTGKIQRVGLAERLDLQPLDDQAIPKAEFRAASTEIEKELLRIWGEVLKTQNIGIDDSFFALGGDSILATKIMVRLTNRLGARISLVDFMDTPTIAAVAERIESERAESGSTGGTHLLVAIQPHGSLPPLFCLPGLDGSLLGFWELSRRLGPEQPIFAFAANETGAPERAMTIGEMAAACIKTLEAQSLAGPYFLLGNCFGGFIAYEMARQLANDGKNSARLILLDCFNHMWRRKLPFASLLVRKCRNGWDRSLFHLKLLKRLSGVERLAYLRTRFGMLGEHLRDGFLQHIFDFCIRTNRPIPRIASNVRYANRWAERSYERKPYSEDAALFRTTNPAGGIYPVSLMGWEGFLQGRVDLYDFPGDHLHMLVEPTINSVAETLKKLLQKGG